LPFRCLIQTVGAALLPSLCLLSGCVFQTAQIPSLPPSDAAPHDDPARDAQLRLFIEAHRAFQQGRYSTAILFFTRFIERSPDSPRLAEAYWWLGQAHERNGDVASAMTDYRMLAGLPQPEGARYEKQALQRLDELRGAHPATVLEREVALSVEARALPPAAELKPWLQGLTEDAVSAIVLDATPASIGERIAHDSVKDLAGDAHELGLSVWVALNVHQPQGLELQPEWMVETMKGKVLSRPDIAHPDYQTFLEGVVRTLAQNGCDGLFLPARPAAGFAEEWSSASLRTFASSFGLPVEQMSTLIAPTDSASERPAEYWRWAGWKARSYAKLVTRLRAVLRERNPRATVLVEVHQTTVDMPPAGLDQYGEDLAELAHLTGSLFLVRRDHLDAGGRPEHLGQQVGTRDRVWVGMAPTARPIGSVKKALRERSDLDGWNVFVMPPAPPAIP